MKIIFFSFVGGAIAFENRKILEFVSEFQFQTFCVALSTNLLYTYHM